MRIDLGAVVLRSRVTCFVIGVFAGLRKEGGDGIGEREIYHRKRACMAFQGHALICGYDDISVKILGRRLAQASYCLAALCMCIQLMIVLFRERVIFNFKNPIRNWHEHSGNYLEETRRVFILQPRDFGKGGKLSGRFYASTHYIK